MSKLCELIDSLFPQIAKSENGDLRKYEGLNLENKEMQKSLAKR